MPVRSRHETYVVDESQMKKGLEDRPFFIWRREWDYSARSASPLRGRPSGVGKPRGAGFSPPRGWIRREPDNVPYGRYPTPP